MSIDRYIRIVLDGYVLNKDSMIEYLVEKCVELEKQHISRDEFLMRISDAYDEICINKEYNDAYSKYVANALFGPIDEAPAQEPKKENFGIDLRPISNYNHQGILWQDDLAFIGKAVRKAREVISHSVSKPIEKLVPELKLATIFDEKNNGFEVCKGVLEHLEITFDGKTNITKGKMGKLSGAIQALIDTRGMLRLDKPKGEELLPYFNAFLGTPFKTFSTRNKLFDEAYDDAQTYITRNFKK